MNKTEICVPIRDEKELQQAREILLRNGEEIDEEYFSLIITGGSVLKFSIPEKNWFIGYNITQRIKIPLSELEAVLRGESDESPYYPFFKFMSDEHNLILTDTEMSDIINEAKKVIEKLKND